MEGPSPDGFDDDRGTLVEEFFMVVDDLALGAVLALDEADALLARAGVETSTPPSDRWYSLIDRLIVASQPAPNDTSGSEHTDRHIRRLLVTSAAFLAAEAIDLGAHCARLASNHGFASICARLRDIATAAGGASRAVLARVEAGRSPATAPRSAADPTGRRTPWRPVIVPAEGPVAAWRRELERLIPAPGRSRSTLLRELRKHGFTLPASRLNTTLRLSPASGDRELLKAIVTVLGEDWIAGGYETLYDAALVQRAELDGSPVPPLAAAAVGVSGLVGADPLTCDALARQVRPPVHALPTVRGRDELIAELLARLDDPTEAIQVLAGKGGCGKSTVALQVADQALRNGVAVWWVSADDANQLVKGMLAVATQLGLTVDELNAIQDTPATTGIDLLWRRLDNRTQPWLLVLDDADDLDVLTVAADDPAGALSWVRPSVAGTVLITSRVADAGWWNEHARLIEVPDLKPEAGALMVLDRMGEPSASHDPAVIEQTQLLSRQLGGVPLALHNAGRYLRSPLASHHIAELVTALTPVRRVEDQVMSTDPTHRIRAICELSLTALTEKDNPEARTLLRLLSCYAPERTIPWNVIDFPLLATRGLSPETANPVSAWKRALNGLLEVGLIESTTTVGQSVTGIAVHPLIAEVSRNSDLGPERLDRIEGAAVSLLLQATYRLDAGAPADWPTLRRLEPHTYALLEALTTHDETVLEDALTLANRIAAGLTRAGLFVLGEELIRHSLRCTASLGGDHPAILAAEHTLAWTLGNRGQRDDAERRFRQLLEARMRISGPADPGTLAARDGLAWMLAERGQLREAHQELTALLPDRQRHLGFRHPDTLATRHRLAWIAALLGRMDEAERELRRVLPERVDVLGPDHMDVFGTRYRLAWVLARRAKLDEAERHFQDLRTDLERALEPHHAATLMVRSRLAWTLAQRGQLVEAERGYRGVLADRERVLGKDHLRTLRARHDLAIVLCQRGAHEEAEALFRQVLADRERVLGKDHLHSLDTRGWLATLLGYRGRLDEAERRLSALIPHRQRAIGADHSATLIARYLLARVVVQRGHFVQGEALLDKLLTDQWRLFGPHDRHTMRTRDSLAWVRGLRGALDESELQLRDVLHDQEHVLGKEDPDTLKGRERLGWILAERGSLAEAEETYRALLPECDGLLGPDHPHTLTIRYRRAWVDSLAGHDSAAELGYRSVLADQQRVLGDRHPHTLRTRGGLARSLLRTGQLRDAEDRYRSLLRDQTRFLGPDHPDTLYTRNGLAVVRASQGELVEAERSLQALLVDQETTLGGDHRHTLTTRNHLAWVRAQRGHLVEAMELWKQLALDCERALGYAHPDTIRAQARLAASAVAAPCEWRCDL